MSATRDKSQGFGFNYKLPEELVKKSKPVESRVQVNIGHVSDRADAIEEIRQNLDRLQSLHQKLHKMLEELNDIAGPKGKK